MKSSATRNQLKQEDEGISLRELISPLFRKKRLLVGTLVGAFALLLPAGLLLLHTFKSQMAVLVNRERVDSLITTGVPNQTITEPVEVAEEEINSEAELLVSQDVLEKVVRANHLQDGGSWLDWILPKQDEAHRVAQAVKKLARRVKVRPSTKANIIDISYSSGDPRRSYAVLNSLAAFYLEKHASVHRPQGSYAFFAAETDQYKKALYDTEARLRDFAASEGGAAPDIQKTDLDLQLANSIGQLHTTEQAIAADQLRIRSDEEQMKATPQRSTTQVASTPPDMLLQQLGSSLLAAETKRTQLLMKYDPSYPLVKEADQELDEAKAAFEKAQTTKYVTENTNIDATYELLREDLAKTKADLGAQRASLSANQASVKSLQGRMTQLAQKALDQEDLTREQKADEQNYLLYMSKREQARTSEALDKTKIENVAIAIPPSIPVLPVMTIPMVILLAFAGASFIALMTAYAFDYFDSSFRTPGEVADTLGIPVVVTMAKRTA